MLTRLLERLRNSFASSRSAGQICPNPDFDPQVHAERVLRWQANNSDERLRTNYACLNPDSILLDLGGFHGDFAFCMNGKYGAICHVFEVIRALCEKIMQDRRYNEKITVYPFGLARSNRQEKLFLAEEGSSTLCNRSSNENQITIDLMNASEWFAKELQGRMVDLM